ncbi:MAG: hypothetical protein HQK51_11325 [Oligoflexia bacterium]|nr:hypothetical protein [Oligoflexia bacterium]
MFEKNILETIYDKKKNIFASLLLIDIKILIISSIVIVFTWIIFLGLNPNYSIANGDAIRALIPEILEMASRGYNWEDNLFNLLRSGGHKVNDISGLILHISILNKLGLSPTNTINLTIFFYQLVFAFLSIKLSLVLSTKEKNILSIWDLVGMTWLSAFAPIISWRIFNGHIHLLLGSFCLITTIVLICCYRNKSLTPITILLAFFVYSSVFQSAPYMQTTYYSFLLAGIIIIFYFLLILLTRKKSKIQFFVKEFIDIISIPALLVISALLINTPQFLNILLHSFSDQAHRLYNSSSIVYSYTTATCLDWLASIFWSQEIIKVQREFFLLHETNYPIGPLIIFAFISLWRICPRILILIPLLAIFIAIYTMNLGPSQILIDHIPGLNMFRVPARIVIPLILLLPALSINFIRNLSLNPFSLRRSLPLLPIILLMFFIPSWIREIIIWIAAIWIIARCVGFPVINYRNKTILNFEQLISPTLLLIFFAFNSVLAFKERSMEFTDTQNSLNLFKTIGEKIKNEHADLRELLNRVAYDFEIIPYSLNQSSIFKISSIDGYVYSGIRFNQLYSTLLNIEFSRQRLLYKINSASSNFDIFSLLYNIRYILYFEKDHLEIRDNKNYLGAAWFSSKIIPFSSLDAMKQAMVANREMIEEYIKQNMSVNAGTNVDTNIDTKDSNKIITSQKFNNCALSYVKNIHSDIKKSAIEMHVVSMDKCPLTVSLNYNENIKGWLIKKNNPNVRYPINFFPAYWSLIGFMVPEGEYEIIIAPKAFIPWWSRVAQLCSFLIFLFCFLFCYRKSRPKDVQ